MPSGPHVRQERDTYLLVRFALGSAALARRELITVLRAHAPAVDAPPPRGPPLALDGGDGDDDDDDGLGARAAGVVAELARRWPIRWVTDAAQRIAAYAAHHVDALRAGLRAEAVASMPLARAALADLLDRAIDATLDPTLARLRDNGAVRELVEEQTAHAGQDAIARARAATASADTWLEQLVRRRRRRRPPDGRSRG